jgi:hypothetical protein
MPCARVSFAPPVRASEFKNGLWRSLVAHLTGGQGVAGSNPVSPTHRVAGQRLTAQSGLASL